MKELSIEEKAKAYDEAIKRLEDIKTGKCQKTFVFTEGLFEHLFPELTESEDERIRNFISNELACLRATDEKGSDRYEELTKAIDWLKKQGEQKSADEPKFKVGNWVVCGQYGAPCQIESIKGGRYYFTSGIGIPIESVNIDYHLWTIQDAKDCDVLVASDGSIFLFKGTIDCACKHYIALTTDGAVKFNEGLEHYWETSIAVHPATKEQRDTLMKAMADAGYTFDFEKKKLKKIEQKHTPKHKVGDTIYYNSFGELKSMIVANVVTDSTDNPLYEDKEGNAVFEKGLIDQKSAEVRTTGYWNVQDIEQKPAKWSEQDEMMIKFALTYFRKAGATEDSDIIKWLKSLKDRVQPQPQQEWSEEDEVIYYGVIETEQYMLDVVNGIKKFDVGNASIKEDCTRELDWLKNKLKSLRPQSHWKPSEEQMELIKDIVFKDRQKITRKELAIFNSIYNDLRKL